MWKVRVRVSEEWRPGRAVALMIPIPPDTAHQRLRGFTISGARKWQEIVDSRGLQRAAICADRPEGCEIEMDFGRGAGSFDLRPYRNAPNAYTAAPPELRQAVEEFMSKSGNYGELLRRIVNFTASRFEYGPKSATDFPATSCDLMVGNCIDIHGFLLAALQTARIEAAYVAGYWVANGERYAQGMHCWVSTSTRDKVENWDVAQHLSVGHRAVRARLNPISGTRFAMSMGRGLRFELCGIRYELGHLVQPIWLLGDGRHMKAASTAEIIPRSPGRLAGSCVTQDAPEAPLARTARHARIDKCGKQASADGCTKSAGPGRSKKHRKQELPSRMSCSISEA